MPYLPFALHLLHYVALYAATTQASNLTGYKSRRERSKAAFWHLA